MRKSTPPGSRRGISRKSWPACREPRHAQNQFSRKWNQTVKTHHGMHAFIWSSEWMLTCQDGLRLHTWGDVTATPKGKRSLKVILTHTRQFWGHICSVIRFWIYRSDIFYITMTWCVICHWYQVCVCPLVLLLPWYWCWWSWQMSCRCWVTYGSRVEEQGKNPVTRWSRCQPWVQTDLWRQQSEKWV